MSNNGPNVPNRPNVNVPEGALDATGFNLYGLQPVKSVFHIDCEKLSQVIREVCAQEIEGLSDVTYEVDKTNGIVHWYLWFQANSKHFVDNRTANTPLGKGIPRFSQEFINFAKKYGWTPADDGKEGKNEVNLKSIVAKNMNPEVARLNYLQISISPFIAHIFDAYNKNYQNTLGKQPPQMKLYREWNFRKGASGNYHSLLGLTVEKYMVAAYQNRGKPRANRSGNFV